MNASNIYVDSGGNTGYFVQFRPSNTASYTLIFRTTTTSTANAPKESAVMPVNFPCSTPRDSIRPDQSRGLKHGPIYSGKSANEAPLNKVAIVASPACQPLVGCWFADQCPQTADFKINSWTCSTWFFKARSTHDLPH